MQLSEFRKEPKVTGIPTEGLFLLIGDTKCGKTTFAASFPDSIVIEMEKGRADRLANARVQEVNSLEEFGEVLEEIMQHDEIKTVVIDSIDTLAQWVNEDIAKAAGIPFLGKVQKGVDNMSLWGDFGVNVRAMTGYVGVEPELISRVPVQPDFVFSTNLQLLEGLERTVIGLVHK